MNQNETRTLWISVASALFAVFLLYSYTQEKTEKLTKDFGAQETVVVAVRDINEMETIDESMVEVIQRPKKFLEPSSVSDPELIVGKVALAPIKEKEQILENKIMEPGPVTGLSLQVAPNKRAVTIPIDEMRGVAKLIKPGDRIDILAALDIGKGVSQKKEVHTIMQNVPILATGLRIANELPRLFEKTGKDEYIKNIRGDTSFSSITIEATPDESQRIVYILSTSPGSLFLTLRHPSDQGSVRGLTPSTINSLLGKTYVPRVRKNFRKPAATLPIKKKPKKRTRKKRGPFVDL